MVSNWVSLLASRAGYCITHPSQFFDKMPDKSYLRKAGRLHSGSCFKGKVLQT